MTDEIIKQEQPQKKFNWANLPIILAISFIILHYIINIILIIFSKDDIFLSDNKFIIFLILSCIFIIPALLCPISLIFQCINKNKTIIDKVLIGINILFSLNFIILFIFCLLAED